MTPVEEWEVEMYASEQLCCEMANTILQMFAEKKVRIHDSQLVLAKVKRMIDCSIQSAKWGDPFACELISDESSGWSRGDRYMSEIWNRNEVAEEFNRRKDHGHP